MTLSLLYLGFRDIHNKLVDIYGYRVEIPHCKQLNLKKDDNEKKKRSN